MESSWNAKGNSVSNSIMWIAGIITALLCIALILRSIDPTLSFTMDVANYDLENIQRKASDACNSKEYLGKYNPRTEKGVFSVFDNEICIDSEEVKQCLNLVCNTKVRKEIDLKMITFINIEKHSDGSYDFT